MDDERVRLPVAGTNSFLLFLFKSIILKFSHRFGLNSMSQYPIHINTSEPEKEQRYGHTSTQTTHRRIG